MGVDSGNRTNMLRWRQEEPPPQECKSEVERLRAENAALKESIKRCHEIHGIDSACEFITDK